MSHFMIIRSFGLERSAPLGASLIYSGAAAAHFVSELAQRLHTLGMLEPRRQ